MARKKRLTDKEFDAKQEAIYTTCLEGTNLDDWDITTERFGVLTEPRDNWIETFAKGGKEHKGTRSEADVQDKDDGRLDYEPKLNLFVYESLSRNPKVPD